MSALREERAITMVELLVSVMVGLVVFMTTVTAFAAFMNQSRRHERQAQAQDTARRAVDRMLTQLRSAMAAATTTQPVERYSSSEIVFLVPSESVSLTNNPRGLVHTRYCLDSTDPANETLWLQTLSYDSVTRQTPPSTLSCPGASAWTVERIVAQNLVNQLESPQTALFSVQTDGGGNVTDVAVRPLVDVDTQNPPKPIELQSSVTLRNLNRSPTAQLSCQAANGHALCDASASADPDGQTLTFAWQMNSSPLAESSYRLDQPSLTSGTTYSFRVTVTDSGGLTASASQSLLMP